MAPFLPQDSYGRSLQNSAFEMSFFGDDFGIYDKDKDKKRKLQGYSDGYGKGSFRNYSITVKNSKKTAQEMFNEIRTNFSNFTEGKSYFKNLSSKEKIKLGDEIAIIGGPGFGKIKDGSPLNTDPGRSYALKMDLKSSDGKNIYEGPIESGVTVTRLTEDKNHYSMTFQTWKGHVEAGTITFSVTQNSNNTITMDISSIAKNSNFFTNLAYHYLGGKRQQTEIWRGFLDNFIKFSGGVK